MSNRQRYAGRVAKAVGWLLFPIEYAFRPSIRAAREGTRLLRDLPVITPSNTFSAASSETAPADRNDASELSSVQKRTLMLCRLFAILMLLVLIWWCRIVFFLGRDVFSPASIELLAIAIVMGSQCLILGLTNWQARTGRAAGFLEFLSDGRNVWPR
ncbi:hypothetical protein [Granulibacter bethesdensis]|nr:hypothetical protein [Granulibacter bethesdensis]